MARSRIRTHQTPTQTLFCYHPQDSRAWLWAWVWAGLGGLALGLAAAMTLLLAGMIEAHGEWATFGMGWVVAGIIGAGVLYGLIYVPAARQHVLRVTFDHSTELISVRCPHHRRESIRVEFLDTSAFRLETFSRDGHNGCALIMDTTQGPVRLLALRWDRRQIETDLAEFAARLTAHLDMIYADYDDLPPMPYEPPGPYVPD